MLTYHIKMGTGSGQSDVDNDIFRNTFFFGFLEAFRIIQNASRKLKKIKHYFSKLNNGL